MKVLNILTRIYLSGEQLETSVPFYESVIGAKCGVRFDYPEAHLELAQVGSFLLIAGPETVLAPFRATQATFRVDSLAEWKDFLLENGATLLKEPTRVPTGMNMLVKHPDGVCIEYVQHIKEQVEVVNLTNSDIRS
jgi:predicted enzyme related to lactoylglutathione lyase